MSNENPNSTIGKFLAKIAGYDVETPENPKSVTAQLLKEIVARLEAMGNIGRYLSAWDCTTGLPETNPQTIPYNYTTGDYFLVSKIAASGGTNYMPDGSTYDGTASTTVDESNVALIDMYRFDGTVWTLLPLHLAIEPLLAWKLDKPKTAGANGQVLTLYGGVPVWESIPVNNPTIAITQGGVNKGSFTLNQSEGDTIELDGAGGGGTKLYKHVFESLTSPYYHWEFMSTSDSTPIGSEDEWNALLPTFVGGNGTLRWSTVSHDVADNHVAYHLLERVEVWKDRGVLIDFLNCVGVDIDTYEETADFFYMYLEEIDLRYTTNFTHTATEV